MRFISRYGSIDIHDALCCYAVGCYGIICHYIVYIHILPRIAAIWTAAGDNIDANRTNSQEYDINKSAENINAMKAYTV